MPHIILDDEQAKIIAQAKGSVEIRDRSGRCLGYLSHGFTAEEIAEAERRAASDGPWYTTQQVLEHLRSLEAK